LNEIYNLNFDVKQKIPPMPIAPQRDPAAARLSARDKLRWSHEYRCVPPPRSACASATPRNGTAFEKPQQPTDCVHSRNHSGEVSGLAFVKSTKQAIFGGFFCRVSDLAKARRPLSFSRPTASGKTCWNMRITIDINIVK